MQSLIDSNVSVLVFFIFLLKKKITDLIFKKILPSNPFSLFRQLTQGEKKKKKKSPHFIDFLKAVT